MIMVLVVVYNLYIQFLLVMFFSVPLTVADAASGRPPGDPAAVIDHALPLTGEVTIQEVWVLAADGQHVETVTEVLQLHPDRPRTAKHVHACS